jgi:predicted nucleic acid-binding protein
MTVKFKKSIPFKNAGTYLNYHAGEIEGTTSEESVSMVEEIEQLLIFPKVESKIKLNGSTEEIYLPANIWTPISIRTNNFIIKTISEEDKIYWQGWSL